MKPGLYGFPTAQQQQPKEASGSSLWKTTRSTHKNCALAFYNESKKENGS
jgi:hypothetical protein